MKKYLILLMVLSTDISAWASDIFQAQQGEWKHVSLQSEQGVQIQIDYQTVIVSNSQEATSTVNPIWINLVSSNKPFLSTDQVQVVMNNYASLDNNSTNLVQLISGNKVNLTYQNGKFTGQVPSVRLFYSTDDGDVTNFISTIAVVVDGQWQINPLPIHPGNFNSSDFLIDFN